MSSGERRLAVDRTRAAMRAAWMLALGVLLSAGAVVAGRGIRWRSMWSADPVTLAAMVFFLVLLSAIALAFLARGARWAALWAWPRETDVVISARGIVFGLGPFGTYALDWSRMRVEYPELEEEMPAMEDDPLLPALHHPGFPGEICERVMQFCGVTPFELFNVLSAFEGHLRGGRT